MTDPDGHFRDTIGAVPESVALLQRHAPELFAAYVQQRAHIYREPPEGHLDRATTELLFTVLDVAVGHEEGARAHARAGIAAGLTAGQIMEALSVVILICGHHVWARAGAAVMREVEAATVPPA